MGAPRIRKQVYDLTFADLRRFPVWEYALDEEGEEGQDEATVRPFQHVGALDPSWGMLKVYASFVLADGSAMWGYLQPSLDPRDLGAIQPVIVSDEGQVGFWYGRLRPTPADVAACCARLNKTSSEQVFPIEFASAVELAGGPLRGRIPGLVVLRDVLTGNLEIVT